MKRSSPLVRSLRAGTLAGVGFMAAVDEIIFHQLLAWHHFYDRSTTDIGLMTDGLLHAAELLAISAAFIMLLDLGRRRQLSKPHVLAGLCLGAGGFQLFDGIINHKVLRLHQIRYVDNVLPYDLTWNAVAIALLLVGFGLLRQADRRYGTQLEQTGKS